MGTINLRARLARIGVEIPEWPQTVGDYGDDYVLLSNHINALLDALAAMAGKVEAQQPIIDAAELLSDAYCHMDEPESSMRLNLRIDALYQVVDVYQEGAPPAAAQDSSTGSART